MVTEGIEPSTVALLAQRSNQLSYATYLPISFPSLLNNPTKQLNWLDLLSIVELEFSRIKLTHFSYKFGNKSIPLTK